MNPTVCVVIAAKDAAATIGEAVRSALVQGEVRRVVVVDDGSGDDTRGAAAAADDGTGRLHIIGLARNEGPSFARNRAIETSGEDFVAILDADDVFLPDRFARLFAAGECDMAADNIAFAPDLGSGLLEAHRPAVDAANRRADASAPMLGAAAFVEGNLTRESLQRGEMGFLKPVIRRELLGPGGTRYDERLRLGEDYALYVRLLLGGARFRVTATCGYLARVRADSLSGRHSTEDLRRLAAFDGTLLAEGGLPPDIRAALRLHEAQTRARFELRRFLDRKTQAGLAKAAGELALRPAAWRAVTSGIARDKLADAKERRRPSPQRGGELRFLFPFRTV